MTIVDEILEQTRIRPGHPAIVEDRDGTGAVRTVDYAGVGRAILRGRERRDVRPGDRCGLIAPQGADFILGGLEVMASGACLFPIAAQIPGPTRENLVRRVKLHHLMEGGGWRQRTDPGDVDGQGDEAFRAIEPAFIRFTSGTTHRNKGVILGHDAVCARIAAANRGLAIGPEDRVLWLLPMAHHWVVSILLYLSRGASILVPHGGAAGALAMARAWRATVTYAAPQDYEWLAAHAEDPLDPGPRLAISTASGLTQVLAGRVRERLGLSLTQALGMIEVGLPAINLTRAATKPLSVGPPLPDYRITLQDESGQAVVGSGPQYAGEVCIEGPGFFSAYMDPWRPTPSGPFATGDQGYFDADGDLFIVGRRKNRILTGGMKFFCEEVEQAIGTHPAVAACRVSGRADAELGEVPVAELELHPGADPVTRAEMADFLSGMLPPHMIPVDIIPVASIPRTPTGKIRRW